MLTPEQDVAFALAAKIRKLEQTIRNQETTIRDMAFVIAAGLDLGKDASLFDEVHYEVPQSAVDLVYTRFYKLPEEIQKLVQEFTVADV